MSEPRKSDVPDALMAALLAGLAVAMLWGAQDFSPFGSIFPRAVGIVLLLGSLAVLWRTLRGGMAAGRSFSGLPSSIALMVVLLVWIMVLEKVGFTLASWFGFVALALIAAGDRPSPGRAGLYAVVGLVLVLALQFLFQKVLSVRLPAGELLPAFMG